MIVAYKASPQYISLGLADLLGREEVGKVYIRTLAMLGKIRGELTFFCITRTELLGKWRAICQNDIRSTPHILHQLQHLIGKMHAIGLPALGHKVCNVDNLCV